MFSPTPDPVRPAKRSLRDAIRNAADLAIAFVTLESYGLDDLRRTPVPSAAGLHGTPTDDAATAPGSGSAQRAAAGSEHGLDTHRRAPLRSTRTRRPGAVPARTLLCLTPLEPLAAPSTGAAATAPSPAGPATSSTAVPSLTGPATSSTAAPRRRTTPQDAPH